MNKRVRNSYIRTQFVIRRGFMNIQYYGHSCFKITTKPAGRATEDVVIFIDPFDRSIGLRPPQGHADIVFVTHNHCDHNNVAALKDDPVIIDLPGEYSAKGVNAIGLDTYHDKREGMERGHNTVFLIESEDLRICHLGDLGCDLTSSQLEEVDGIDILFIPVGGKYTLDGKEAAELVRKVEPKIVIPIHYKIKGSNIDVADEKKFCAELGNCPTSKVSKLSIKKKDLEGKNMEVVIINVE